MRPPGATAACTSAACVVAAPLPAVAALRAGAAGATAVLAPALAAAVAATAGLGAGAATPGSVSNTISAEPTGTMSPGYAGG